MEDEPQPLTKLSNTNQQESYKRDNPGQAARCAAITSSAKPAFNGCRLEPIGDVNDNQSFKIRDGNRGSQSARSRDSDPIVGCVGAVRHGRDQVGGAGFYNGCAVPEKCRATILVP
jgi:hypothetical protein